MKILCYRKKQWRVVESRGKMLVRILRWRKKTDRKIVGRRDGGKESQSGLSLSGRKVRGGFTPGLALKGGFCSRDRRRAKRNL